MSVSATRQPHIWFNLTSSHKWNRPPVGIIRVEQNFYEHLQAVVGADVCVPCVWSEDQFIHLAVHDEKDPVVEQVVDGILPAGGAFDASYDYVYQFVKKLISYGAATGRAWFGGTSARAGEDARALFSGDLREKLLNNRMSPSEGDVLVTMGLDWDYAYKERLYELKTRKNVKVVSCCYDLIPALYPQYCVDDVAKYFKEYFYNIAWASDLVLCISEQSRKDFEAFVRESGIPPVKTCVIELGDKIPESGEQDAEAPLSPEVARLVDSEFLLFVSTIERRKNHEVLYRAYHLLGKAGYDLPKLVFVGMQGWGVDELMKDISLDPVVRDKIVRLTHLSDRELKILYEKALFCLYPSLYEGWGLPVAEALAVGQFVISSNRASLPEVGGELIPYLDPWNPQLWADEILKYVNDRTLLEARKTAIRKEYRLRSWRETAEKVAPDIRSLLGSDISQWEFQPGYDCKTMAGYVDRGALRSSDQSGYLMFGPNIALSPGRYRIEIEIKTDSLTHEAVQFDICHKKGTKILANFAWQAGDTSGMVVHVLDLKSYVDDLEVRAVVIGKVSICINKLIINSEKV